MKTGVIQPIAEISEICRQRGVLLHSDMVQAFGKMEIDLGLVDAASFAGHKIYGPKGTGFLFLRSGLPIQTIMYGGSHENQRRPGDRECGRHRQGWRKQPSLCLTIRRNSLGWRRFETGFGRALKNRGPMPW